MVSFFFLVAASLFLLPSIIAFSRGHDSAPYILAVNLLFGLTCIGWIVALVWALNTPQRAPVIVWQQQARRD